MEVINLILELYIFAIIAVVIISWVNPGLNNQFTNFLYKITEPPLEMLRRVIPPLGGLDLSPMVLIFIIILIQRLILRV